MGESDGECYEELKKSFHIGKRDVQTPRLGAESLI